MRRSFRSSIFTIGIVLLFAAAWSQTGAAQTASKFVTLNRIDDGISSTNEQGYTNSSINCVAYITWNLFTVGDQQFAGYYGENPDSPQDPFNRRVFLARRTHGDTQWEVLRTTLTANNINDDHDNINFAIDGDGFMHMSWGMHNDLFHYAISPAPVTGNNPLAMGPDLFTITGRENTVTYPQFFNLPDGDVLYLFREGFSGNGDSFLNVFDCSSRSWSNVHENATGTDHVPFIKGTDFSPNWNSYLNRMVIDKNQRMHATWTDRFNFDSPAGQSGYQTNHNIFYGYSDDFGASWHRMDGSQYTLPIVNPIVAGQVAAGQVADIAVPIPEGSSLINQTDMAVDQNNRPLLATWLAENPAIGNQRRQYMVFFWDGEQWQSRQVSNRTNDPVDVAQGESVVRDLGRPTILTDDDGRTLVVYRDNEDTNGLTVVHTGPFAEDPERLEWFTVNLTFDNLGRYEPTFDPAIWESENKLHMLYQQLDGFGNNFVASDVFVMEWDAKAYFNAPAVPGIYEEQFDGLPGGMLDGTEEDINGETWLANGFATLDGVLDGSQEGSAVLPFNPEPGQLYTLSMDVLNSSDRWVGIGFSSDAPSNRGGDSAGDRFAQNDGVSWMLYRQHENTPQDVHVFAGPNTAGQVADNDIDFFTGELVTRQLKIVLDTRHADGVFTADYFIDGDSVLTSGVPINSGDFGLTIDDINFVGFTFDDVTTEPVIVDNFFFGREVEVPASELTAEAGKIISGGVDETAESDDDELVVIPQLVTDPSESALSLVFDGNLSSDQPSGLDVEIEFRTATPGLTGVVEALNWETGQYESVGTIAESTLAEQALTYSLSATDHVESGTGAVRTRVRWQQTAPVLVYPWQIYIDRFGWLER